MAFSKWLCQLVSLVVVTEGPLPLQPHLLLNLVSSNGRVLVSQDCWCLLITVIYSFVKSLFSFFVLNFVLCVSASVCLGMHVCMHVEGGE